MSPEKIVESVLKAFDQTVIIAGSLDKGIPENAVFKHVQSLLKEMPNFINEILNGMVSDEIRDKIKKILEDYLAGDEFKNKINDSINGKIDTELKKEMQ